MRPLADNFIVLFLFIAAPTATIDLSTKTGSEIPIEDRPSEEITLCKCSQKVLISPKGMCTINLLAKSSAKTDDVIRFNIFNLNEGICVLNRIF